MRKIFNNSHQPVSFKKRGLLGYRRSMLRFGTAGLRFTSNYTIEKLHFVTLKKKFKFFLKNKKSSIYLKTWFFLSENTPIFKKGKNSRMGKGKGVYQRLAFRVKKNQIFIEFFNLNVIFLKKISSFLQSNSNLKNAVVDNNNYKLNLFKTQLSYYKIYKRF